MVQELERMHWIQAGLVPSPFSNQCAYQCMRESRSAVGSVTPVLVVVPAADRRCPKVGQHLDGSESAKLRLHVSAAVYTDSYYIVTHQGIDDLPVLLCSMAWLTSI